MDYESDYKLKFQIGDIVYFYYDPTYKGIVVNNQKTIFESPQYDVLWFNTGEVVFNYCNSQLEKVS